MSLQGKDQLQVFGLVPVVQEAVIAGLLETGRKYMHQIPADEFRMIHAVGTPFLMIKVITETRPFIGIPELFTGSGKYKQLFFIKRVQASKIFSLKFITEDFGPDKKIFFGFSYLMVRRKTAA